MLLLDRWMGATFKPSALTTFNKDILTTKNPQKLQVRWKSWSLDAWFVLNISEQRMVGQVIARNY